MPTKPRIFAALAALTLVAAGTLIGAAAIPKSSAGSAYLVDHGYDECRFVDRYDRWGHVRTSKICEVVPY